MLPVAIREPELLASVHFLNRGAWIIPGRSVASGILRELFEIIEVCRLCQRLVRFSYRLFRLQRGSRIWTHLAVAKSQRFDVKTSIRR